MNGSSQWLKSEGLWCLCGGGGGGGVVNDALSVTMQTGKG